jgi:hypothetical protein
VKNQSTGLSRAPAMATSSVAETFRSPDSILTSAVRSRPMSAARSAWLVPASVRASAMRRPRSA